MAEKKFKIILLNNFAFQYIFILNNSTAELQVFKYNIDVTEPYLHKPNFI